MSDTPNLDIARHERRKRVRSAAVLAQRCYPGPVGTVLAAELNSWDEHGSILVDLPADSLIMRLVEHLEAKIGTSVALEDTVAA